MSNSIEIFNDTVTKQSILQGLEHQRSSQTTGTFTLGELAYTRDTKRVFVGDSGSDSITETIGGAIIGNKYLSFISSDPNYFGDNDKWGSLKPLSYTSTSIPDGNSANTELKPISSLFGGDSRFKRDRKGEIRFGNFLHKKEWNPTAIFDDRYATYQGDYVYDDYQNAFIIFDTHIKPSDRDSLPKNEYNTRGDGYVKFTNYEPDGISIICEPYQLEDGSNNPNKIKGHNILKIGKISGDVLANNFDKNDFIFNDDSVAINKNFTNVASIKGKNIKFTNTISFLKETSDETNFTLKFSDLGDKMPVGNNLSFKISKNSSDAKGYDVVLVENVLPESGIFLLGKGLVSKNSTSPSDVNLNLDNVILDLKLKERTAELYGNPLVSGLSDKIITSNLTFDEYGTILSSNTYPEELKIENHTPLNLFESENTIYNTLKTPQVIIWFNDVASLSKTVLNASGINAFLDFTIEPYVYCQKKILSSPIPSVFGVSTPASNPYFKPSQYFSQYTSTFTGTKLWCDYFQVLGSNHFAFLSEETHSPIVDGQYDLNERIDFDTLNTKKESVLVKYISYPDPSQREQLFYYNISKTDDIFEYSRKGMNILSIKLFSPESDIKTLIDNSSSTGIRGKDRTITVFKDGYVTIESNENASEFLQIDFKGAMSSYFEFEYESPDENLKWMERISLIESGCITYSNDIVISKEDKEEFYRFNDKQITSLKIGIEGSMIEKLPSITTYLETTYEGEIEYEDGSIGIYKEFRFNSDTVDNKNIVAFYTSTAQDELGNMFVCVKDIPCLIGTIEPHSKSGVNISGRTSITINDSVLPKNRVYIPNHAKGVVMEVTNISENNILGVYTSKVFEDLGHTFSGSKINEYLSDGKINSSTSSNSIYGGKPRNVPNSPYGLLDSSFVRNIESSITSIPNYAFPTLSDLKGTGIDSNLTPNIYWENDKEKCLLLSSTSGTSIINVPIYKNIYTGKLGFNLRIANAKGGTSDAVSEKNNLAIKIIGYTL